MMSQKTRDAVVAEARRWIGTPYCHNARVLGVGVDCALLPAAVYEATSVITPVDPRYTRDWHLHRSEELYISWVLQCGGREVTQEESREGDLVLWRWGRTYSHGGILSSTQTVIHSWIDLGVVEDSITEHSELSKRHSKFFTMGRV